MKTHRIKGWNIFFRELVTRNKTAEIRLNDRGYEVGDFIIVEETLLGGNPLTGREFHAMITHVLTSEDFEGLQPGYCLLSFSGGRVYTREENQQETA